MKDILIELTEHKTLDKQTAKTALLGIAEGKLNHCQLASFLTVFMMRNITVDELDGFREAMLELCIRVNIEEYDAVDLCGTGGDGRDTFNISTLASFLVAGTGQNVAKHGNNAVSSTCGSSNVLQELGYEFASNQEQLKQNLDQAGICFFHAPLFHPAMKNIAPVRKELGLKTFFNMLGPMVNPSFPQKQLVGVFNMELARLYGYIYQQSGKEFAIVHSVDGYDEVSLTGPFRVITPLGDNMYTPEEIGLSKASPEAIRGGADVPASARIFLDILKGKGTKEQNEVVIANAGFALYACNMEDGIESAIEKARESLFSGKALNSFNNLINGKTTVTVNG